MTDRCGGGGGGYGATRLRCNKMRHPVGLAPIFTKRGRSSSLDDQGGPKHGSSTRIRRGSLRLRAGLIIQAVSGGGGKVHIDVADATWDGEPEPGQASRQRQGERQGQRCL